MSNYNSLKTTIDANIKQNGRQEITGQILNSVLNQMVTTLGAGYQFAGVATLDPATDPGTPDAKVFYIANGKGTYTNFGGVEVTEDDVVVLYWDSSWHKVSTGIASQAKLSELESNVNMLKGIDISKTDTFTIGAAKKVYENLEIKAGQKYKVKVSASFSWTSLGIFTQHGWTGTDYHTNIVNGQEYEFTAIDDITEINVFLISSESAGDITTTLKVIGKVGELEKKIEEPISSDKIEDGAVTTSKVYAAAITSEKIANNAVDIEKISFKDEIRSANRCDPSACVYGYINMNTGALVTGVSTRYASDFIPVSTKGLYCNRPSGYGAAGANAVYDAAKNYLRGFTDNVYNYQDGDAYVRWTLATDGVERPFVYIIEGTSAGSYTPFVPTKITIKSEYLPTLGKEYLPALSLCGKDSIVSSSDTIVAGASLQITEFPQYLKGNGVVTFSGKLTSFDEMSVGFGTSTNSIAVKVDATNVYIIKSGSQLGSAIAHGLNISDFINITFENSLAAPKIVLSTINGLFVHTMSPLVSLESYGLPVATMGAGTIVTNAILRATSNRFNKPIWVCGDSYTSLYDERWTKQMINTIGEDNFLLIGLAGGSSSQIYSDLQKALAFGTPKFLIWCLGMNDTYANWLTTFESLKTLCSQNGIELILQTIPIPNLSTSNNQEQINTAIKASGYRYVDAALAMSPNSSYPWYDGYNADGVHPTVLGAKVLASRFLSDFPEFMQ